MVLRHRYGETHVWRGSDKQYHKTVIQPHWKKYSEFMFWGCFSYDRKGSIHIWKAKTVTEKCKAITEITKLNEAIKPIACAKWEEEQKKKEWIRTRPRHGHIS